MDNDDILVDTFSDTVLAKSPYNTRGTRQVRNANDNVYTTPASDGTAAGAHLLLNPTPLTGGGYAATFNVGLQIS